MPKWIDFPLSPKQPESGKTQTWDVVTKSSPPKSLGRVSWFPAWRRYCFFSASGQVQPWHLVFDAECLRDIATFCDVETAAQKARRSA